MKTKVEMIGEDIFGAKACCVFEVDLNWLYLDPRQSGNPGDFFPHEIHQIVFFGETGSIARMIFPPYIDLSDAPELK